MLSLKESLKILKKSNALLEGHFILSSGLRSEKYVQCAQLFRHPKYAVPLCKSLSSKIRKGFKKIDLILSPAMGGVILGYEIGRNLNLPNLFAERVQGKFELRRGFKILKNSKVLIVEDVITTGKSSSECNKLIKKSRAKLLGFACLINRSHKKKLIGKKIVSQVDLTIPTYHPKKLPSFLKKIKPIKPGSRGLK